MAAQTSLAMTQAQGQVIQNQRALLELQQQQEINQAISKNNELSSSGSFRDIFDYDHTGSVGSETRKAVDAALAANGLDQSQAGIDAYLGQAAASVPKVESTNGVLDKNSITTYPQRRMAAILAARNKLVEEMQHAAKSAPKIVDENGNPIEQTPAQIMPKQNPFDQVDAKAALSKTVVKGSMIDRRNQKKYPTVRIGTQTWMAKNLDFKTDSSWCYDNKPKNCAKYGRLYSWNAALHACPSGWHLPSDQEWSTLIDATGGQPTSGKSLKAISSAGSDAYGFAILLAGEKYIQAEKHVQKALEVFDAPGREAIFWSSTQDQGSVLAEHSWTRTFFSFSDEAYRYSSNQTTSVSVRCLSD
jgi:uncharacterized protein (TIGR02145 family)